MGGAGGPLSRALEGELLLALDGKQEGAVTVTGWCQLRVASGFLL